jgi:hypothetical protein
MFSAEASYFSMAISPSEVPAKLKDQTLWPEQDNRKRAYFRQMELPEAQHYARELSAER